MESDRLCKLTVPRACGPLCTRGTQSLGSAGRPRCLVEPRVTERGWRQESGYGSRVHSCRLQGPSLQLLVTGSR